MLSFFQRKKKILIIEDDENISSMLASIVVGMGFEALTEADGARGGQAAIKHKPALILMDIMLPTISGVDAVYLIRANPKTKNIPIIMCTAKSKVEDIEKSLAAGANDYIAKPFEVQQLRTKISKFLEIPG